MYYVYNDPTGCCRPRHRVPNNIHSITTTFRVCPSHLAWMAPIYAIVFGFLALFALRVRLTIIAPQPSCHAIVSIAPVLCFNDAADAPRVLTSKEVMQEGFRFGHSIGMELITGCRKLTKRSCLGLRRQAEAAHSGCFKFRQ